MRRVLSQLADGHLLGLVAGSIIVAAVVAVIVARRLDRPVARILAVLLVTFPILAVTLFDRQGTVRGANLVDGLTWWLDGWDEVPRARPPDAVLTPVLPDPSPSDVSQ